MTQVIKKKKNRKGNLFEINQFFLMMESLHDDLGPNVLQLFQTDSKLVKILNNQILNIFTHTKYGIKHK